MPFKQTLLSFSGLSAAAKRSQARQTRPKPTRTPSASTQSNESDTIIVQRDDVVPLLPTPDESATDVSSQVSQSMDLKEVSQGRAKQVPRSKKARQSQDCLLEVDNTANDKGRSVSGETLVTSTSQSSLLQSGITALDLPWSMSSIFHEGKEVDVEAGKENEMSTETLITVTDEEETARLEKAAALKARKEEISRIHEAKVKAADDKATRRSSRASMLSKVGELVSDVASGVLGKRGRDVYEKGIDRIGSLKNSMRPRSMVETSAASTPSFEGPMSKKRRLSDGDVPTTDLQPSRKSFSRRKEKRWLVQGLYAGQPRTFDGRLTESKNKRKQEDDKPTEPVKENSLWPLPMFAGERLLKQGREFKLPFDVFSPLPHGQPKPDEWRKTNKNVFIGDAADEWRDIVLKEHSTCMCRPATGCDSDCMNRCMYYECDSRNCNLTEEQCGNRSFEGLKQRVKKGGKYNVGVEVIKTADRGYGVRSNRTFAPNQIIVEYTGEIITQDEADRRVRGDYKDNECYYLMLFDQNMIIDATRGSIARFVNHSCAPNSRMEKWTVNGKPRMALFAGDRGIMTGDELTYDYNFDPYSQKNVQECRCGATTCRGVLGPRPKDKPKNEDNAKKPEGKLAGVKRKIADAIDEGLGNLAKKAKVAASSSSKPHNVAIVKTKRKSVTFESPGKQRHYSDSRVNKRSSSSKIKKILGRTSGTKAISKTKKTRVVSSSSAAEALLSGDGDSGAKSSTLSRRTSVRTKALVKNMVQTVKGAQSGKNRSIRPVEEDQEMVVEEMEGLEEEERAAEEVEV